MSKTDDSKMASSLELEKNDLFIGERNLQEILNPFYIETKITCVIKINNSNSNNSGSENDRTETHNLILLCPTVKPKFTYLGTSQEINFNKVFIGTSARAFIQIQNISFERIYPVISLLNPVGSFKSYVGLKKIEVDPEHIWCQPLTFAPLENKGVVSLNFILFYFLHLK